jgi:hypothetical protein
MAGQRSMPAPDYRRSHGQRTDPEILRFAEEQYRRNGKPTSELACVKAAMGPLKTLYGPRPFKFSDGRRRQHIGKWAISVVTKFKSSQH